MFDRHFGNTFGEYNYIHGMCSDSLRQQLQMWGQCMSQQAMSLINAPNYVVPSIKGVDAQTGEFIFEESKKAESENILLLLED